MTRWASTSWFVHSAHRLGSAHCVAVMPRASSANLRSLSRNASADLDIQMLLKKVGLVREQLAQQWRMVDLEVIAFVVPNESAGCGTCDVLGMARVHQCLPKRYANEKRRCDFRGPTFRARQRDADDVRGGHAVVERAARRNRRIPAVPGSRHGDRGQAPGRADDGDVLAAGAAHAV